MRDQRCISGGAASPPHAKRRSVYREAPPSAGRRTPSACAPERHLPNEDAIIRLVGAILLEQNDEWAVQRARYMTLETIAPMRDDPAVGLPALAS